MYKIRTYSPSDALNLLSLFCQTIKNVNSRDYSLEQVNAWANFEERKNSWAQTFINKEVWVCEGPDQLAGFCELRNDGYIDRFYIDYKHIGQGVGRLLYDNLEGHARSIALKQLSVDASITARPFFKKMGFTNEEKQTVFIGKVAFTNFRMTKEIS